jgi:hypothetical protein
MATLVRVSAVLVAGEKLDPKDDQRRMNGDVEILITGDLGEIHISVPFEKCRSRDDAAAKALQAVGGFLDSARRATDLAMAEYGLRH